MHDIAVTVKGLPNPMESVKILMTNNPRTVFSNDNDLSSHELDVERHVYGVLNT
jgi:hypothetical protein